MGLVRSAVRAYAIEEHPPAVIMALANEFLASLGRDRLVTVSYSQVHPHEGLITTVSAGHLPAMITSPAVDVHDVPSDIGPPLGVMTGGLLWPETTSTLPAYSVLAVFTDGLVETRTDDISVGLDRVRDAVTQLKSLPVEQIADGVLATRWPSADDIALVVARATAAVSEQRVISRRLPPTAASVSLARRFVRQLLTEWAVGADTAADVELALSEIVTNAARHSEDTLDLRLSCTPDCVRFSVGDSSHRMPGVVKSADADATAGRGLHMVDSLATRWGIESDGLGKTIWCEFER
jgi:anti-sigma regulatory factor (Ser/Thr protein kinase)